MVFHKTATRSGAKQIVKRRFGGFGLGRWPAIPDSYGWLEILAEIESILVTYRLGHGLGALAVSPRLEKPAVAAHMEFPTTKKAEIPETYPTFRQSGTTEKTHSSSLPAPERLCKNTLCL